ncbi:MAG: glycyl-radical enzyme activating protein [Anaerolineae bacterium]|nr:glycyl-radical enzyme activating protein [Anaerolineae bacterium]
MYEALSCQVIEISRGTMHDGPGLRTTVFLKGCPLRCLWCQNPEGMSAAQGVWWEERKCIRCLACVEACPSGALWDNETGIHRDRGKCTLCGACVEACPSQAMTFTGQEWSLDDLVRAVLKDRDYYEAFGGGVTVSGGEPLSQHRFVGQFFRRLREAGVHTALDTCGSAPAAALDAVLPYTDHVLFDIKILDPALHQQFTGQSNGVILQNLMAVAETMRQNHWGRTLSEGHALRLWIRTPLIPDATATVDNIAAIARFIHQNLRDVVERWELCAFNSACKRKYDKLGLTWTYEDYPLMDQHSIDALERVALAAGIPREKLVVSGLVAKASA